MDRSEISALPVKNEKGFTLIEIIIAIMLLVVAILSVASVTTIVVKGNLSSKTMTTATTLAKDKMEEFKNMSYASVTGGTDYVTFDGTVQSSSSGTYFQRTWTVTADSPITGTKEVQIVVDWPQQNPTHTVDLKSLIAMPD